MDSYDKEYEKWRESTLDKFSRWHRIFNAIEEPLAFDLVLENTGRAIAENLVVEIEAVGDVVLIDPEARQRMLERMPATIFKKPPQPETFGALIAMLPPQFNMNYEDPLSRMDLRPRRKPREFLWTFENPALASAGVSGECDEFRHGGYPHAVTFLLGIAEGGGSGKGAIRVRWSAKNLPETSEQTFPVQIPQVDRDTERRYIDALRRDLDVRL